MKKVTKIGERCIHRFKNKSTGEIVEEFSTDTDYNERFLNGNDNPPEKEGFDWVNSERIPEFDTEDGLLHEGEYSFEIDGEGKERVLIQTKDKFINAFPKEITDFKEGKMPFGFEKLNEIEKSQVKEIPNLELE